jgi:hypothetical protein
VTICCPTFHVHLSVFRPVFPPSYVRTQGVHPRRAVGALPAARRRRQRRAGHGRAGRPLRVPWHHAHRRGARERLAAAGRGRRRRHQVPHCIAFDASDRVCLTLTIPLILLTWPHTAARTSFWRGGTAAARCRTPCAEATWTASPARATRSGNHFVVVVGDDGSD